MGLLDGLLGQVLGGTMSPDDAAMRARGAGGLDAMLGGTAGRGGAGAGALMALLPVVLQLLQRNGGLGGMLSKFQDAGFRDQADSWVSTGRNMPIDGDALSQVLGGGQIDEIAQQLGMSRREAADQVASAFPEVVDRMTPRGSLPPNGDDLVERALAILQRGER